MRRMRQRNNNTSQADSYYGEMQIELLDGLHEKWSAQFVTGTSKGSNNNQLIGKFSSNPGTI